MTIPTTALTPNGAGTPTTPKEPWTGVAAELEHFGADHAPPNEGMYSHEVGSRSVMREHGNTQRDVLGYGQAHVHSHNRNHVAMLREAGLDAEIVGAKLYETHMQVLVANARGTEPDPERQQQMQETIRRELREQYGAERAERLQRAVTEFVQSHPRLRQVVGAEGFGAQPSAKQALDALIEHVRKVRHI